MSGADIEETAWRNPIPGVNYSLSELKEKLSGFQPVHEFLKGEASFPQVNILLFGSIGSGKSSIFNTWNSAIREKIFNAAISGAAEHSLTRKFSRYPILSKGIDKPAPLKCRICDIRGLEPGHLMNTDNMTYVLEGNIPDRCQFDPSITMSKNMSGFKKDTKLHEKIHCVAIVVDASIATVPEAQQDVTTNIKEMQTVMNNLGVRQVVILTKIDVVSEDIKLDVYKAFYSSTIEACVAKVSEVFGVNKNLIFPMKNYESELVNDNGIDTVALDTLKAILNECDAHLSNHLDEIRISYRVARWTDLGTHGKMLIFFTFWSIFLCYVTSFIIKMIH